MKHQRKISMSVAAAFAVLLALVLPIKAHADSITLGQSNTGSLSFTSNGNGTVSVATAGLTGGTLFQSDLGTYSLGAMSFTTGTEGVGGLFPVGANSETFSYSAGDGDFLTGTVVWSAIRDHTPNPGFFGLLTITTIGGDSAFTNSFGGVGSLADIDFTTNRLSHGFTLSALAGSPSGTKAFANLSSGEIVITPEPNSLVLFGIGMLGLAFWMRRKFETEESIV